MVKNQQEQEKTQQVEEKNNPWTNIVYGILLIVVAIFLYTTFDKMEKEGGSIRLNWIVILAYKIGGKWTVVTILGLIGSFLTYSGLSDLIKRKQS